MLQAELLRMSAAPTVPAGHATSAACVEERERWRELEGALHRFYRGRIADAAVRDDLVQDVLLRVHARREQLRDEDRLEAWMFRIARHALVDHLRRARPGVALPEELADPEPPELAPSRAPQILGAYLRGQIEQLPPRYREVLELTELEGLGQREAAARLELPYSTLKSRVQRGRDLLHAALLRCCAVELDARGRVTDFEPRDCGCG